MTRREALLALGSAIPVAAQQTGRPKSPAICISSSALRGVGYAEIGEIVKQIGFDGIDIAVKPGGLIEPQAAPVDEVRALESIHGAGLETPILTTAIVSSTELWGRTVLALAGRTGVGLFRSPVQTRRDAIALSAAGREYKIALTVTAAAKSAVGGLDPDWSGISLDSSCFHPGTAIGESEMEAMLPFVRAVSLFDLAGSLPVPLGKGEIDFQRMFRILAQVHFAGPVTILREYRTSDEPGAIARDLDFVRKLISQAGVLAS